MVAYLKLLIAALSFVLLGISIYSVYQNYFLYYLDNPREPVAKNAPKDITDPFLMGQYYFNTGDRSDGTYDLNKAKDNYQKAIEADPGKELLAWHQLGRINFLEGDFNNAIHNFNKQIEYFSDELPNVYYMLGLTYGYKARGNGNENDWYRAEENFLKYLEYDPTSPWARVDLSWIYFAQGKYKEMLPVLEVGLLYEPDNPWLLNMYGLALLNSHDVKKANYYFLWAKAEAGKLTVEDWGRSYPGNNPSVWERGLTEFRDTIEHNLNLTKEELTTGPTAQVE